MSADRILLLRSRTPSWKNLEGRRKNDEVSEGALVTCHSGLGHRWLPVAAGGGIDDEIGKDNHLTG